METIQIVLDKPLLQATDRAAEQAGKNRSALVRDALREHLKKLQLRAAEERDRQGYLKRPRGAKTRRFGKGRPRGRQNSARRYSPLPLPGA